MSAKKISQQFQASYRQRQRFGRALTVPAIVGTIHSTQSLRQALKLRPGEVDFFELRVDHFVDAPERLLQAAPRLCAPAILTVRNRKEGGAITLSAQQRRDLFAHFLPAAALVDIELRSADELATTIRAAREKGIPVILSAHHFRLTPSAAELTRIVHAAKIAGADVVKIAAHIANSDELGRLLGLFDKHTDVPLSIMGMGPLGKVSRLVFACAGSLLNYGYLGSAQVPGQWGATVFKKRLLELLHTE